MQSDIGKLFIGGISWDTNEERLAEYFSSYREVLEAVIMKDRITGRARGFGFIVFMDPVVADRVVKEKHNIDGRLVEAKNAVPKDDHSSTMSRNSGSIQGSPSPVRTRKIFVGGLASSVTESDFKTYFEHFGIIKDAVVMYDHNTQRPRGFGFITYESEISVDNVLLQTFHELNGKMVEVKRAVPKEPSPSPNRSPLQEYNSGMNRLNSILNGYNQGYLLNGGGLGVRMDSRFSPVPSGRNGFGSFGSGYAMGLDFEVGMNPNYGGNANTNSSIGYGRGMDPYYNTNRFTNPVVFDGANTGNNSSFFSSPTQNMWGNGMINHGINSTNSSGYVGAGTGIIGARSSGNSGINLGSYPNSPRGGPNVSNQGGILGYRGVDRSYNLGAGTYERNGATNVALTSSYSATNGSYDATFGDIYGSGSVYADSSWHSANIEQEESVPFDYGLGAKSSDVHVKTSPGYPGAYGASIRQTNRGLAG